MNEEQTERVEQLLAKATTLAQRLDKGRGAIRGEEDRGSDRADLYFEKWLSLLTDYEQTVDELRRLGVGEDDIRTRCVG